MVELERNIAKPPEITQFPQILRQKMAEIKPLIGFDRVEDVKFLELEKYGFTEINRKAPGIFISNNFDTNYAENGYQIWIENPKRVEHTNMRHQTIADMLEKEFDVKLPWPLSLFVLEDPQNNLHLLIDDMLIKMEACEKLIDKYNFTSIIGGKIVGDYVAGKINVLDIDALGNLRLKDMLYSYKHKYQMTEDEFEYFKDHSQMYYNENISVNHDKLARDIISLRR